MRTNTLRQLIKSQLSNITSKVYYKTADADAMYPHLVFNLRSVDMMNNDANRKDYILEVDVWNKGKEADTLDMCDSIEDAINMANLPFSDIYPSFFYESRTCVPDDDKTLNHYLIKFSIQLFE